jgi:hypothetical protein
MTRSEYAVTINGKRTMALRPMDGRSQDQELARWIGLLDGTEWYSVILWKVAEGKYFDEIDFAAVDEYIQCAGSVDRGLTCEIRENSQQYVLGRPSNGGLTADSVIEWDGIRTTVRENEVLDSDETAELFVSYLNTGSEPSAFARRRIEL